MKFVLCTLLGLGFFTGVAFADDASVAPTPTPTPTASATPRSVFVPTNEFDLPVAGLQSEANHPTQFSYGKGALGLSYGHMLTRWLAIQANSSFVTQSSTNTEPAGTEFDLTVGPSFKFAVDNTGIRNAFFLTFGAGVHYAYINSFSPAGYAITEPSQSTSSLAYYVEFGKSFALLRNVSYSPAVSVSGFSGHDIFDSDIAANPVFQITPIRVSIIF
jgi:hypothetical protein